MSLYSEYRLKLYRFHRKRGDIILGKGQQYEKIIFVSSLVLAISLGVGCSNEKTAKTDEPKKNPFKRKGINGERCFQENE